MEPQKFHRSLPDYHPTKLLELTAVARELGIGRVFVKDESMRMGLPAFKILGASWATYRAVTDHLEANPTEPSLDALRAAVSQSGSVTLVTATDGNHGRAIARMAKLVGASSRVFAPDIIPAHAAKMIEAEGAELKLVADDYDTTVRLAAENAASDSTAILIQDTAWEGYVETPQSIVDGYSTLFRELEDQLSQSGVAKPDLVVVPTGVGSLLQAAVTFYRSSLAKPAAILAVEPQSANCVTTSLLRGQLTAVATDETNMTGLNCGTPSSIAWPYLRNGVDASVGISDEAAGASAIELGKLGISSGPCGAASLAGLRVSLSPNNNERRKCLKLPADATVVLLNTEGNDRQNERYD